MGKDGAASRRRRVARKVWNGYAIVTTVISVLSIAVGVGSWRFPNDSPIQVHVSQRVQVLFGVKPSPTPQPSSTPAPRATPVSGQGGSGPAAANGGIKPGVTLSIAGVAATNSSGCASGSDAASCELISFNAANNTNQTFTIRLNTADVSVTDNSGDSYPILYGTEVQQNVYPGNGADDIFTVVVSGLFSASANSIDVTFQDISSYRDVTVSYRMA